MESLVMKNFEEEIKELARKSMLASEGNTAMKFASAALSLTQVAESNVANSFSKSSKDKQTNEIDLLCAKAAKEDSSEDALRFSEAALNLANAANTQVFVKINEKQLENL